MTDCTFSLSLKKNYNLKHIESSLNALFSFLFFLRIIKLFAEIHKLIKKKSDWYMLELLDLIWKNLQNILKQSEKEFLLLYLFIDLKRNMNVKKRVEFLKKLLTALLLFFIQLVLSFLL